jgi:hypothetical protein
MMVAMIVSPYCVAVAQPHGAYGARAFVLSIDQDRSNLKIQG